MIPWRQKANRIIAELCSESYRQRNLLSNGQRRRKRHRQYSVPPTVEWLVDCLNRDDEETAKAIFLDLNLRDLAGLPVPD